MERSRELNWSKPAVAAWLRWASMSPNTRYGSMLMDAFVAGHDAGASAPTETIDADLAEEIDQLRDALDTAQNELLRLNRERSVVEDGVVLRLTFRRPTGHARALMSVGDDGRIIKSIGLDKPTRLLGFSLTGADIDVTVQQVLDGDDVEVRGLRPVVDFEGGPSIPSFTVRTVRFS